MVKTINVSFENLETGEKTRYWYRWELLELLGISKSTFQRDLDLLIPIKQFGYISNAAVYTDYQRHCFQYVHSLRCQYLNKEQIKLELKKGIPDYVPNVQRSEDSIRSGQRHRTKKHSRIGSASNNRTD